MRMPFLIIFSLSLLAACDKADAPETNNHAASSVPIVNADVVKLDDVQSNTAVLDSLKSTIIKDGDYCFSKVLNKDVTAVQLHIAGNAVTGKMNWLPYEKDSARGTLKGQLNKAGELELLYDYMIEGNQQTETKIMKIENEKLMMKVGELLDTNNDGNLIYKDVNKAKYLEILERVDCKNLASN